MGDNFFTEKMTQGDRHRITFVFLNPDGSTKDMSGYSTGLDFKDTWDSATVLFSAATGWVTTAAAGVAYADIVSASTDGLSFTDAGNPITERTAYGDLKVIPPFGVAVDLTDGTRPKVKLVIEKKITA